MALDMGPVIPTVHRVDEKDQRETLRTRVWQLMRENKYPEHVAVSLVAKALGLDIPPEQRWTTNELVHVVVIAVLNERNRKPVWER